MARLYPAFWIAVTLTTLGIALLASDVMQVTFPQYLMNLTMLGNFVKVENIDPVYWTLQVELKFYFWIVVILLFNKIKHIEYFIMGWLLFSVLEIFHFMHGITHLVLMPEWAPYFSAGALFYLLQPKGYTMLRVGLLILAYGLLVYFALQGAELKSQLYEPVFSPVIVAGLISIFYLIFTLIILGKTSHLYYSWFTILGATTYPLYLIHQKIGQIAYLAFGDSINKYLLLFIITTAMIVLAYLLHRYLEAGFGKGIKRKLEALFGSTNKVKTSH